MSFHGQHKRNFCLAPLQTAFTQSVTPGAACAIASSTTKAMLAHAGSLAFSLPKVTNTTIYDLSSVTKILSTTLIAAHALELNKIDLDEKPWCQWPQVRIRHILAHNSGLPAWIPLYEHIDLKLPPTRVAASALEVALTTPLKEAVGKTTCYSDIGFIALGHLLEQRLRDKLDVIFEDLRCSFFPNSKLHFRPSTCKFSKINVAPAGYCAVRKRHLHGEVNDTNCFVLGGVSGHAGLFGSIRDVAEASSWFLKALTEDKSNIAQILRHFASYEGPRALGFDKPSPNGHSGNALSSYAVGHLGFTGTSLWFDIARVRFYALLTNRVENNASLQKIKEMRIEFHEIAKRYY